MNGRHRVWRQLILTVHKHQRPSRALKSHAMSAFTIATAAGSLRISTALLSIPSLITKSSCFTFFRRFLYWSEWVSGWCLWSSRSLCQYRRRYLLIQINFLSKGFFIQFLSKKYFIQATNVFVILVMPMRKKPALTLMSALAIHVSVEIVSIRKEVSNANVQKDSA